MFFISLRPVLFFVLAVTLGNLVLVARGDLVLVVRGDLVPERRGVLFVEELGDFLVLALILLSPLCRMLLPCLPLGVLRTLKDMDWRRSAWELDGLFWEFCMV